MLEAGVFAPDFTLKDQKGNEVRLSQFRGKKVVVYFYPKDLTPGCTREACAYSGLSSQFDADNVVILGISKDSVASHEKFAVKHNLPFILLSDENKDVLEAFGVWQEKKMYGKVSMGVVRSTFVLDEDGKIIKVFKRAKPDTNAQEALDFIRNYQKV
ncbi:thioredoxin-dependent thiol peroxidase [Succinatimonas hippei]|uniref:thioredoxin-dependent thiol peroxidase n=1 Tax=Succinatimonas hippei TaxID=626938 RepID=UPI0034E93338